MSFVGKVRKLPERSYITSLLRYEAGALYWIASGRRAGSRGCRGYMQVGLDNRLYLEHRLIFMLLTGEEPECIDHIDNNKSNNLIENLRGCTRSQNTINTRKITRNTSGCPGVKRDSYGKWQAQITIHGVRHYLGYFLSYLDACAARKAAENRLFGEFAPRRDNTKE